jgi:hypothetical protein
VAPRSTLKTLAKRQTKQLVVCIDNEGYATSLEKRKFTSRFAMPLPRNTVCFGSSMSLVGIISIRKSRFVRSSCRWP